jgi:TetR/AcrR family transcriptional regulator, transcriptional repressor for nem operon
MGTSEAPETASKILDVAERLVQMRGFNGFSYADIAEELRIRKASLHHHFATKAALGKALIHRYEENFLFALKDIEKRGGGTPAQLRAYVKLYSGVLRKNRMCLCGMLAADFETLPKSMRDGVRKFFLENESWLAARLEEGRKTKTLSFKEPPRTVAASIVSTLEGAMLVARSVGKPAQFDAVAERLVGDLMTRS